MNNELEGKTSEEIKKMLKGVTMTDLIDAGYSSPGYEDGEEGEEIELGNAEEEEEKPVLDDQEGDGELTEEELLTPDESDSPKEKAFLDYLRKRKEKKKKDEENWNKFIYGHSEGWAKALAEPTYTPQDLLNSVSYDLTRYAAMAKKTGLEELFADRFNDLSFELKKGELSPENLDRDSANPLLDKILSGVNIEQLNSGQLRGLISLRGHQEKTRGTLRGGR